MPLSDKQGPSLLCHWECRHSLHFRRTVVATTTMAVLLFTRGFFSKQDYVIFVDRTDYFFHFISLTSFPLILPPATHITHTVFFKEVFH